MNAFRIKNKDEAGPKNLFSGFEFLGTWGGKSVVWNGVDFLTADKKGTMQEADNYEVGRDLYLALKDRLGWSHGDAAEALGLSQRTCEGMALGRVSRHSRKQLVRLALTLTRAA